MPMNACSTMVAVSAPMAETVHCEVELRCFSYEERFSVLGAMLEALDQCGCWMESRDAMTATRVEMRFTARLEASDELYSGLIAAGAELTRESHMAMTWLCTRRRHQAKAARGFATIGVRLEMNFMEEPQLEMGFAAQGLA